MTIDANDSDEVGGFLWDVHKYTNEYIRFADTKAAFVAGISTALIGGVFGSSLFDAILRSSPCAWTTLQWLGSVGLILLVVAVVLSVAAIRPRLWNESQTGYIFWGSIAAHRTAEKFSDAVQKLSKQDRIRAVSDHLFLLATIAERKFTFVDWAVWAGALGGGVCGLTLFLQHGFK